MNVLDLPGPQFLQLYVALLATLIVAALLLRYYLRQPGGDMPPGRAATLHPIEVAYLARGAAGATDAAMASLVQRGSLGVHRKSGRITASSLPPSPNEVSGWEQSVYTAAAKVGGAKVSEVRRAAAAGVRSAAERLEILGLVMSGGQRLMARLFPALLMVALLVLGVLKVHVGMQRNRPVSILFFLCFVTLIAALAFVGKSPLRTRRGSKVLGKLQAENAALRTTAGRAPDSLAGADLMLAMALFGPAIFATGPMGDLGHAMAPPSQGGTGCGGGSSGCGSSSCGGGGGCGGGGCGGCGGGD
jgi:uncharacterized protein (TIGR04222 family)